MSADNFVFIKKFGKEDFRWGMGFGDEVCDGYLPDERLTNGPFKSPKAAADNAYDESYIIEYGIKYHNNCLVTE